MGSHGHVVDFDAAHDWVFILNAIQCMGTVGTVFHACCLLETTTIVFPIRTLPSPPTPAATPSWPIHFTVDD
jgi:hypothetical protein